ncbi:hypothetical protein GGI06_002403, partial [Coemansia sp. S85]
SELPQKQQQPPPPPPPPLPQPHNSNSNNSNNRNILPNGEPGRRRDDFFYRQSLERKREKNKIAARIKRTRKKQRLEALELREKELSERRQLLENELRLSRLSNRTRLRSSSSCDADNATGAEDEAVVSVEARAEVLQGLCHEVRAVCAQAQGAIDTLTDMRRELSALFDVLE